MKLEDEIKELLVNPPIGMTAAQLEFWLMGYNACLFRVREYIKTKEGRVNAENYYAEKLKKFEGKLNK